jgi:hypothetical protein
MYCVRSNEFWSNLAAANAASHTRPDFRQNMMNKFRNNPQPMQNMMNPMMDDPEMRE